jgi:hypothetical protein
MLITTHVCSCMRGFAFRLMMHEIGLNGSSLHCSFRLVPAAPHVIELDFRVMREEQFSLIKNVLKREKCTFIWTNFRAKYYP